MIKFLYMILLGFIPLELSAQSAFVLEGTVVSETSGSPLAGAGIRTEYPGLSAITDNDGHFLITVKDSLVRLTISYIGYRDLQVTVKMPSHRKFSFSLTPVQNELEEVPVSTGYQTILPGRTTGSFVSVSEELLNRKVSTSIINRLEDIVPGLIFNRGKSGGNNDISIRGTSTIYGNSKPLIVLDNFPFEGDINDVNPNDVETITVLKDAAAASIWGTRAGNGVIVITTKKGRYNQPVQVSFNSNVTVGARPDLFYQPVMSSADFIDMEKTLFAKGYYQSAEYSASHSPLTPVVELLIAKRDGDISASEADQQVERLKNNDVRNDIQKYFYRNSVNQQYFFNINGGSENQRYNLSAGYDHNLENEAGNAYSRITLNAGNTYTFFKHKLELTTALASTFSVTKQDNPGAIKGDQSSPVYPYAMLADGSGNSLPVVQTFRDSFKQQALARGLLDWGYRPLDELSLADNKTSSDYYRINTGLKWNRIINGLSAEILYQYTLDKTTNRNLHGIESYYTRDLINRFTSLNVDGSLTRPIPTGDILDAGNSDTRSHYVRGQLSYSRNWGDHQLSAIAGSELRDQNAKGYAYRLYGYDQEHAISKPVDYLSPFTAYYNPYSTTNYIDDGSSLSELTDRYFSWFGNAAYTYRGKYIASASARFDQSNIFGVKANQKGVPLWSAGMGWILSNESFYQLGWLPELKIRATYGYNGNVNRNLSAYTTAVYLNDAYLTHLDYAEVVNPPNPELAWEKVKIINLALDFQLKNNVISGTLEVYRKKGDDLIGEGPLPSSSGMGVFRGNTAQTSGKGIDLSLASRNLNGRFKWTTNFFYSYIHEEVTKYLVQNSIGTAISDGEISRLVPQVGKPLLALYSYKWAGLDPETGDPQGYLNNVVSKDWAKIIASASPENIIYNGPARPTGFGSLRNTFTWNAFSLSANITYRFNYYFRKNSVNYYNVLRGLGGHGDYSLRWQKPGDEQYTGVPSVPEAINLSRDNFYLFSEALVEKGDHVRLQDVSISWAVPASLISRKVVRNLQFYLYANNLGILWKAADGKIDPDYQGDYLPPRTLAAGIRADF